jgi:hypothetical protein
MLDSERGPSTTHDRLSGGSSCSAQDDHPRSSTGMERRGQECPRHAITTNLLNQRASIAAVWFFFGGDDDGGGHAVAGFEVQQANALRVAAGFADRF